MRTAVIALCSLALVAALVVGVRQAREASSSKVDAGGRQAASAPLTRAQVSAPVPGAPRELAALRRRVNVIVDGGTKAFDAQLRALRGHPVVVNLWASWCGPCRIELPHFQRQANKRGARVAFLGVNVGDERGAALALAERYPMPYPSFADPRSNIAAGRFGSRTLPVTAFYDARGKLEIVKQGQYADESQLAEAIDRYALR